MPKTACLIVLSVLFCFARAQINPKVLVVQAHPDDETSFGGLVFKTAHDLNGTVSSSNSPVCNLFVNLGIFRLIVL